MTTHSDREQIGILNGMNTSSSSTWKQSPTVITVPSNSRSNGMRQSGVNPFNLNPNHSRPSTAHVSASVGNVTSTRTLLAGNDTFGGGRPGKRRKVEEPSKPSSSLVPRAALSDGNRRTDTAKEIIFVDDEDNDQGFRDHEPRHHNRQSSDELNIVARPSSSTGQFDKFKYIEDDQRKAKYKPPLAPDPPEVVWLEKEFVNGGLDSDHIESFSESDAAPRSGIVRNTVQKFEDLGKADQIPPKIDLTKKQKPRAKQRMKGKPPFQSGGDFMPGHPPLDSPLPSSTLSRNATDCLPVEAYYIDDDFHPSKGRQIEFSWTSDTRLTIKSANSSFNISTTQADCKSITYSRYDKSRRIEPVVQIDSEHRLVTVKFDVTSPTWSPKGYEQFMNRLSHLKLGSVTSVTVNVLWKQAQHLATNNASEASSERAGVEVNLRMKKLKEIQERKTRDGHSLSSSRKRKEPPGHTPPGSPLTGISKSFEEESERRTLPASSTYLRRSARNTITARTAQASDQDEVILVYPQGTPGAVNITSADLRRLEPGEFLNDTLIEFGLKFWLKSLEQENPELASQIHIFNSFFYKKLNQKDPQQAYESVRKWTSRFDIFQKKYVIVPINEHLHWYLAIIYEPGHVLSPTTPDTPSPRKETRSSKKTNTTDREPAETTVDRKDDQNPTPSEAEVEHNLNADFQNSCTIESPDDAGDDGLLLHSEAMDDDDDRSSAALSYVSAEGEEVTSSRPSHNSSGSSIERPSERQDSLRFTIPLNEEVPDSTEEFESPKDLNRSTGIPPTTFYGSRHKNGKGKQENAEHDPVTPMSNVKLEDGVAVLEAPPKTYIFTMDSLGTRHPQAIKRLANYLKMEAQDKKGVQDTSSAIGKFASVPVQPNFCDCGVYLLHFAQTFMTRPKEYCRSILTQKPKSLTNKERQEAWHDYKVEGMRTDLIECIKQLSTEWKRMRAASVGAKKFEQFEGDADVKMDDSDTDVELVETVGSSKQSKSARRK